MNIVKNNDTGSIQLPVAIITELAIVVGTVLLLNEKPFKVSFVGVAGRRGVQQVCFRGCGPTPTGDVSIAVGEATKAVAPKFTKEQLLEMLKAEEAATATA